MKDLIEGIAVALIVLCAYSKTLDGFAALDRKLSQKYGLCLLAWIRGE